MSISDKAFKGIAGLRDQLQSMLSGQQSRTGDLADQDTIVTIDEAYLKELAESLGQENMAAAIRAFARDLQETAGTMKTQLGAGDAAGVSLSAHRMKGLFAQFGASDAAKLASELEEHAPDGMGVSAARLLDHVPAVIRAVQKATSTSSVIS
jgi:HPt (histidine-containing phosphotransfer) domain-containing protein